MGKKRDLKALEQRRLRGVRRLRRGYAQATVARGCGVSRNAVNLWAKDLMQGARSALKRKPPGRPARLRGAERASLARSLKRGALAAGYVTELWTLARAAELIERLHGVQYSTTQVWRLLGAMGWSPGGRHGTRSNPTKRRLPTGRNNAGQL